MPILFDAAVEPDDITTFVRDVPTPSTFNLLGEFPSQNEDDNTINFAEIVRTNRTARYRSFDGRVHVSKRDAASEKRVRMLPLSSSLSLGEYERLQQEFARLGGSRTEALERAIYNDAERLTREVQARLEQAWGDVLTDGKLTINENGFAGEADYGVPGNQLVAPGTAWTSTATATVLTNIRDWSDVWMGNNGDMPGRIKTSLSNIRLVQRNKEVIDAVFGATAGRTQVTINELNALLAAESLPTFDVAYETKVDVDDVTTRVLPDDRVVFLPNDLSELGYTAYGVSATALELVDSEKAEMSFEDAPGIVGVVYKEDGVPFRQYTYVDAVAMPVLANARKLLVADVK
jgi:hypothetical protein